VPGSLVGVSPTTPSSMAEQHPLTSARPTFLHSDRRLARAAKPFARFLRVEAAGGVVLILAAVAALLWANLGSGYDDTWATQVRIVVGSYTFEEDLLHVVNDGLMAIFFFVVGMEIKRELVVGELRHRRALALPALAALGGMLVPAAVYLLVTAGRDGSRGWGIPMATDIAFAVGVVALLGDRVPAAAKVLLLTLAVVDDIGAIAVIAVAYTDDLEPVALAVAVTIAALIAVMHRAQVVYPAVFVVAGLALWLMVYESGVHATIAGVVLGLLTPARPTQTELEPDEIAGVLGERPEPQVQAVRETTIAIRGSVSTCERLIDDLHPWTSFAIVPLFALANAGVQLSSDAVSEASVVLPAVAIGLVVGKIAGVAGFAWLAVRLGLARLPRGTTWHHVLGLAAVAGIGFTVSLFITGLAFDDDAALQQDAKLGALLASVVAALVGAAVLARADRSDQTSREDRTQNSLPSGSASTSQLTSTD